MALRTLTDRRRADPALRGAAAARRADLHPDRFPDRGQLGRDGRPAGQQRPRRHDRAGQGLRPAADRRPGARRRRPGGARPAADRRGNAWPRRSAPIAAQIAEDSERLDADWEAAAPELDALSVAAYLDRHGNRDRRPRGRAACSSRRSAPNTAPSPTRRARSQLIWNLPTVDGEAYEVLGNSDERYVIEGGSQRVTDALAEAHGDRIETGRRLVALAPAAGGRVTLRFAGGDEVDRRPGDPRPSREPARRDRPRRAAVRRLAGVRARGHGSAPTRSSTRSMAASRGPRRRWASTARPGT